MAPLIPLFLVVALATTVSALVDEGTVRSNHSTAQLGGAAVLLRSVDEGPINNSELVFI